jgi:hypothetical protein
LEKPGPTGDVKLEIVTNSEKTDHSCHVEVKPNLLPVF